MIVESKYPPTPWVRPLASSQRPTSSVRVGGHPSGRGREPQRCRRLCDEQARRDGHQRALSGDAEPSHGRPRSRSRDRPRDQNRAEYNDRGDVYPASAAVKNIVCQVKRKLLAQHTCEGHSQDGGEEQSIEQGSLPVTSRAARKFQATQTAPSTHPESLAKWAIVSPLSGSFPNI